MSLTTAPPVQTPAPTRRAAPLEVRATRAFSFHGRITLPLVLYTIFTLVPFYWIVLFAFREPGSTSWLPLPLTFDNFVFVWKDVGYEFFFTNSVIVGVTTTLATLLLALPILTSMA